MVKASSTRGLSLICGRHVCAFPSDGPSTDGGHTGPRAASGAVHVLQHDVAIVRAGSDADDQLGGMDNVPDDVLRQEGEFVRHVTNTYHTRVMI